MSDEYGRRARGDDEERDDETRDSWAAAGAAREDLWAPSDDPDRTSERWREPDDRADRPADPWDHAGDRWTRGGERWEPDATDRDERRAWTDDEDDDRATRSWGSGAEADADVDYGDRDRDTDEWGRERATPVVSSAPAITAEAREEDALRSFVESEELPSPERMAAAELEAEREAERDAAEAALAEPEVAGSRRGRFGARSVDGRLARLHLRGGLIPLARAELETMAGQVTLDLEALADLAEARWRSGDLLGAGEAAQAHLSRGGDEVTALVVAVEALTAQGRTIDARRLAAQVLDRTGGELESIFAGQPRAHLWSRPTDLGAVDSEAALEPDSEAEAPAIEPAGELTEADVVAAERPDDRDEAIVLSASDEPEETIWSEPSPETATIGADAGADFGVVTSAPRAQDELGSSPVEETAAWPAADLDRGQEEAERPDSDRGAADSAAPEEIAAATDATLVTETVESTPPAGADTADVSTAPAEAVVSGRRMPGLAARRELRAIEESIDEGRLESVAGRLALLLRTDPDAAGRIVDVALDAVALLGAGSPEAANLQIVRGDALRVLGRSDEADAAYEASRRALEPEGVPEFAGDEPLESSVNGGPAPDESGGATTDDSSYAGELLEAEEDAGVLSADVEPSGEPEVMSTAEEEPVSPEPSVAADEVGPDDAWVGEGSVEPEAPAFESGESEPDTEAGKGEDSTPEANGDRADEAVVESDGDTDDESASLDPRERGSE